MRWPKLMTVGAIALILGLGVAACTESADDPALGAAAQDDLGQAADVDGTGTTAASAAAQGCLDQLELGVLANAGLTDEAVQGRLQTVTAIYQCEPNLDQIDAFVDGLAVDLEFGMGENAAITLEEGRCITRHILDNSDDPRRTLAIGASEADADLFFAAFDGCLSTANQDALFGQASPQVFGADPRLDAMFEGCQSGNMRLCDLLFWNSATGSEYETVAVSCGGQAPATETSCSPAGAVNPETGSADAQSPTLALLAEECTAGDNTACDLLLFVAPTDSPFADVGFTCGGRLETGAVPDCRTQLG